MYAIKKFYRKVFSNFGCKPFAMSIIIGGGIGMATNHLGLGLSLGIIIGFILGKNGVCI
jgi:hypothetical protein